MEKKMAKKQIEKTETVAARNVEEDLIGTPKPTKTQLKATKGTPENKAEQKRRRNVARDAAKEPTPARTAKVKAATKTESNGKIGRPSQFKPTMAIKVLKDKECREGTKAETCWKMVKSSKTVADYLKKREKAGMEGVGGFFNAFVNDKFIAVR